MAGDLNEEEAVEQPYMGDAPATDFHMTFNLPIVDFEAIDFIHFDNHLGEISWFFMLSEDDKEVWLLAPPGVSLDVGEDFNIEFEGVDFETELSTDTFTATATWTGIPEPATATLGVIGLLGLGGLMLQRRRAA